MIAINQKFAMIIHKFRVAKTIAENGGSSKHPTQAAAPIDNPPTNNPTNNLTDDELLELPYAERLNLAHKAWIDSNGKQKLKVLARTFGVAYLTLHDRIHGAIPKVQASQAMQRLSPAKEEAIRDWILDLSRWGWPIRIERLRTMAKELLLDKGDTADLSVHWTDQFLSRHPDLKSKFVAGLDKERIEAQDPEIFSY